jgi:hypothetical protein
MAPYLGYCPSEASHSGLGYNGFSTFGVGGQEVFYPNTWVVNVVIALNAISVLVFYLPSRLCVSSYAEVGSRDRARMAGLGVCLLGDSTSSPS